MPGHQLGRCKAPHRLQPLLRAGSSRGKVNTSSRASCALRRVSATSTAFHNAARS